MQCRPGDYSLAPVGVWLYNRPGGPQIITRSSSRHFNTVPRPPTCTKLILGATQRAQAPLQPLSAAGTWSNDYGSVMTLSVQGNRISGTYQSSTGSTGQYEVSGYQMSPVSKQQQGCPVSLAIEWHSVGKGTTDPSWNWTSGLCGQLYRVDDDDTLVLSHLLVATSDFPGLADQGTYIDKLIYRRVTLEPQPLPIEPTPLREIKDRLNGVWLATDGSHLDLSVHACEHHAFGYVTGRLFSKEGEIEVSGFTDINAHASGLSLQSVSLATLKLANASALSLTGSIDLKINILNVLVMASAPTPTGHSYVQTQVKPLTFSRGQ